MKKLGIMLAVVLTLCMSVSAFADAGKSQQVDYKTDYYMIVESPDGGVDMYSEASTDSPKLNDELIPNGTAIHVEGESKDDAGNIWLYTQLHGMFGFLEEKYLKPAILAEAVASELALYGSKDVNYDITVNAKEDGSVSLYKGPGKKYGTVPGGCNIANGEKLHIDVEVDTGKDGIWGQTTAGEVSGWVDIAQATNTEQSTVELVPENTVTPEAGENSASAAEEPEDKTEIGVNSEGDTKATGDANSEGNTEATGDVNSESDTAVGKAAAGSAEKKTTTPTPKPTGTPTPKPTNTSTPTPKPTSTNTPTPEPTGTNTPTPEPTGTNTPTPEPTSTNTPTPEPTSTSTPTPEPTSTSTPTPKPTETSAPTEKPTKTDTPAESAGQAASSENVEKASSGMTTLIWILVAVIIIGIAVVIWLIKKNKKNDD